MQQASSSDETRTSDNAYTILSIAVTIAIFVAIFKCDFLAINSNLLKEYHKTIITISAIFLAFSPAFFAFIYSNDNLRDAIIALRIKHSVNRYFRYSSLSSLIFLLVSITGVIFSYIEPSSSDTPKIISDNYILISKIIFASSVSLAFNLAFWSILFGNLVVLIVNRVVR